MSNNFEVKKILIVEDNLLNQKMIEMIVKKAGHMPIVISNGKEALKAVRKEKPSLVLLDIKLVEISGIEIGKKIKSDSDLKSIPIIVITSFASDEEKEHISKETCCDHYLTKPFLPNMLINLISSYFPIKNIA